MNYNFEKMYVSRYDLKSVINNKNADGLAEAFQWKRIPQGWDYWRDQNCGKAPLELDVLRDMLEQYDEWVSGQETSDTKVKSDGGPSGYYDFAGSWVTLNDAMEHLAKTRWGAHALHLKDAMKACWRFGGKDGTDHAYDARKLVYSGLRLLVMIGGVKMARDYLQTLLDDPQFKE